MQARGLESAQELDDADLLELANGARCRYAYSCMATGWHVAGPMYTYHTDELELEMLA